MSEEQLIEQVEFNGNGTRLEVFIDSLVKIIVDVEIKDSTYGIHLESVTTLLVLLSVQLHSGRKSDQSNIYRLIMRKHTTHAPLLIKCLLQNFTNQQKIPVGFGANTGHSIVLGIATELWNILTFSRKNDELTQAEHCEYTQLPLATQSILLVLVLVHHWTMKNNSYRNSLFLIMDSAGKAYIFINTQRKSVFNKNTNEYFYYFKGYTCYYMLSISWQIHIWMILLILFYCNIV